MNIGDLIEALDLDEPIDIAFWYKKANRELGYEKYVLQDAQKSVEGADENQA